MSGKIGYYVAQLREEALVVLIPFMSGKIGYVTLGRLPASMRCLNPFYVREDWLLTPLFFLLGIKVLRGLLPTFRLWQKLLDF